MFVVHVHPITKMGSVEPVTYFSARDIQSGDIVHIPLRKKIVSAVVVATEHVSDAKSRIRGNTFSLRKIERTVPRRIYSRAFLKAAERMARDFATTLGAVLFATTPQAILDTLPKQSEETEAKRATEHADATTSDLVLQAPYEERVKEYKLIARESFARGSSLFILTPTIHEAEKLGKCIAKGIEKYTYIVHSSLGKKAKIEAWNNISSSVHPVLIIGTAVFLSVPRHDLRTVIVERDSASSYSRFERPFMNVRYLARYISEAAAQIQSTATQYIVGDTFLQSIHHSALAEGAAEMHLPLTRVVRSGVSVSIADARELKSGKDGIYPVLSKEVEDLIERTKKEKVQMIVYAGRRGLSPTTLCGDCGTLVACSRCESPVVLHNRGGKKRTFLCHRCGEVLDAHITCGSCGSWKLVALGSGIARIEDQIKKQFPTLQVYRIDKDATPSQSAMHKTASAFRKSSGAILLSTEVGLPYIETTVPYSAAIGIDSILSIPDFHIEEKLFGTLIHLSTTTKKNCVLQTRNPENTMLQYVTRGDLAGFAREELARRKMLNYPPYTVLVKVTATGTQKAATEDMQSFVDLMTGYTPRVFPAFMARPKGVALHALLRIRKEYWPNDALLEKLRSLPPQFEVRVHPEGIL